MLLQLCLMTIMYVVTASAHDTSGDYRDTLGVGFKGLGKSAGDLSQQLAQSITVATPGTPSTVQERSEQVYSGAVDGLSGADLNAVVEEVEHEADVLKKAFERALHRALGSVALLGQSSCCFLFAPLSVLSFPPTRDCSQPYNSILSLCLLQESALMLLHPYFNSLVLMLR